MPTWACRLAAHCCTARGAVPLSWQAMHAWLSLEAFAASFTTSGGFCAGAALAKEKRKTPRIVVEWRLLIAPPGLALGVSKVIAKWEGFAPGHPKLGHLDCRHSMVRRSCVHLS